MMSLEFLCCALCLPGLPRRDLTKESRQHPSLSCSVWILCPQPSSFSALPQHEIPFSPHASLPLQKQASHDAPFSFSQKSCSPRHANTLILPEIVHHDQNLMPPYAKGLLSLAHQEQAYKSNLD